MCCVPFSWWGHLRHVDGSVTDAFCVAGAMNSRWFGLAVLFTAFFMHVSLRHDGRGGIW